MHLLEQHLQQLAAKVCLASLILIPVALVAGAIVGVLAAEYMGRGGSRVQR